MTTTVRKEVEPIGTGDELVIEILEDNPTSNRVAIALVSDGDQGRLAIGRLNMGQVFRRQTRAQAESLVDAIIGFLRTDEAPPMLVEKRVEATIVGKALVPPPVKGRDNTATQGRGIELDTHARRDFAEMLRRLADDVETNSAQVEIQSLDVQPMRGGGQTIAFVAKRRK